MPKAARYYAYTVVAAGFIALAVSLAGGIHAGSPVTFTACLSLAILASFFRMRLPGMEGSYSLNTLFILFGLYYLSAGETMIVGCAAVAVQTLCGAKRRPIALQMVFNIANVSLSIATAFAVTHIALLRGAAIYRPAMMAAAAFVQFGVNTLLVSGVLSLLHGKPVGEVWEQWYRWSFPYYLIAAILAGVLPIGKQMAPPESWIVLLPLLYLLHFFYGLLIPARIPVANTDSADEPQRPAKAFLYIIGVVGVGGILLGRAGFAFDTSDLARFVGYLALGMLASTWKVRLPGMRATISVGFVVTLFAIAELPFSQALAISAATSALQVLWKPKHRPSAIQIAFSVASLVISTAFAHWAARSVAPEPDGLVSIPAVLALTTIVLFLANTLMVSAVICLTAGKPLIGIWQGCYFWSFPYYLVGACVAGLMVANARTTGWVSSLLIMPLMGMVYVSYRHHVEKAAACEVSAA
ncbi:MAG TPA: hypothetical protein VK789_15595 [Bryobacteraceae bacterium]|nr:hypothetical protein [Bryobacteraceae bacterium]